MKRFLSLMMTLAASGSLLAQDIYQIERLSTTDLNGTARFVGMGGAMSALGADISVMGSNPAGIGMFRRSEATISGGLLMQAEGQRFDGKGKTSTSFDNIGFVYSANMGSSSVPFFNVGFNYHKSKNFNGLLNYARVFDATSGGPSLSYEMADLYSYWKGYNLEPSPLAQLGLSTGFIVQNTADASLYDAYPANEFLYDKKTVGGVEQYDFNFSFNIKEQFYIGVTVGAYSIDKHSYASYREGYINTAATSGYGDVKLVTEETLSGSGFDVKIGAIVRPIYDSPFRIGVSVTTPTWYNIDYNYRSDFANFPETTADDYYGDYVLTGGSYNLRTPWKFNFSLGHTVGNYLALGAEYEYSDLSTAHVSYDTGYDYYGVTTTADEALNAQTKRYLKGQSTLRLGAELKPTPELAVRVGYNYVSSPIKEDAYYNQFINSSSIDQAAQAAYMNLSDINRYTAGIGYRGKHFYADLSYQYQAQSGDFYPFFATSASNVDLNELSGQKIKLDRSQLLLTLGYRF